MQQAELVEALLPHDRIVRPLPDFHGLNQGSVPSWS